MLEQSQKNVSALPSSSNNKCTSLSKGETLIVIFLQLLGQLCALYLSIKREKAAEKTVAFSIYERKHRVLAAGGGTGKPTNKSLTNRWGKRIPVRGTGHSMCAHPCITLMPLYLVPPHQEPDDVQATSREFCTKTFKSAWQNNSIPGTWVLSLPFLGCLPRREGFSL